MPGLFFLVFVMLQTVLHRCLAQSTETPLPSDLIWIYDVETQGNTVLSPLEIQACIKQKIGSPLNKAKIIATEQKIQALYLSKGYQSVRIETRLSKIPPSLPSDTPKNILIFSIKENNPVRIKQITISPDEFAPLTNLLPLKLNDPLDTQKVEESKAKLLEWLASGNYVAPQVNTIDISPTRAPDNALPASQYVNVTFQLSPGDKVRFGFVGNDFFSVAELSKVVESQRTLNLGSNYVWNIATYLENIYKDEGFLDVNIEPLITERSASLFDLRLVTYAITEGPRAKLHAVQFEGETSPFSEDELPLLFLQNAPPAMRIGFYSKSFAEKASDSFIQTLKEKGFLEAHIYSTKPVIVEDPMRGPGIDLNISLYMGNQTYVDSIELKNKRHGVSITNQRIYEILHSFEIDVNKPLNLFRLPDALASIKQAYLDAGFLDFTFSNEGKPDLVAYTMENTRAQISLEFDEGELSVLEAVEVQGLEKTRPHIVDAAITVTTGDILIDPEIKKTEANLRRMGIFSNVQIQVTPNPDHPSLKTLRISLQESDTGTLSFGPGVRNDLGVRLFSDLSFVNIWGLNHTVSFSLALNRRLYNLPGYSTSQFIEAQAQLAYIWPGFLPPTTTLRPLIMAGQTKYVAFSAKNITIQSTLDNRWMESPDLRAQISYAFERIQQFDAQQEDQNGLLNFSTVSPKVALDLRDNSLTPTMGQFVTVAVDLAPPYCGSAYGSTPIGFYRFQIRLDQHVPLFPRLLRGLQGFLSLRTGYEKSLKGAIPLIKQFALGGTGSMRGFFEQSIIFPTNFSDFISYVNYRAQIDIPIQGALKIALFVDAANLLHRQYSFSSQFFVAVGAGVHYITPVGPLNLDFGFPIAKPPTTSTSAQSTPNIVSFSIGVI